MIDVKTIIDEVLQNYCLGNLLEYENISQGYANENYKITTRVGTFLFRICKEQSLEMIEYELRLMEALREINFSTAFPVKRSDSAYISKTAVGNVVLYEFVAGAEPKLNIETCAGIGDAIGKLSLLPNAGDFHKKNVINLPDCLRMIDRFPHVNCQYPEIFKDFENIIATIEGPLSKKLPSGVVHGDVFPDNTLFLNNKLVAIVDFEEANFDHLLFDVGMTINGFCFNNNNLDSGLLNSFLESYQKQRKLTDAERELLFPYIVWGSVGMVYWHLRHLVNRPLKQQQDRVEELIYRAKKLQHQFSNLIYK